MAIIKLKDVSKLYGLGNATNVALNEINLDIDEGEFIAVMGPSGCGKSTLMNIIGLLDRPTHGNYQFNNRAVEKFRANRRAKVRRDSIGFVFQTFNLLPRLTVLDNVALPLAYKGQSLTKRLRTASDILERVGLKEREYFFPRQLSGGQSQSAAIARALVNNPKIIIADEPTGNLDSESSRLVMELFSEIHKMGRTVLLVTHNPELTRYATRVVYMHDGMIIHDEPNVLGEIPKRAHGGIFGPMLNEEEEDLAGVSAIMKAIPAKNSPRKKSKGHKKGKNTRKQASKKRGSKK